MGTELVEVPKLRRALEAATSVYEVKSIRDQGHTTIAHARRVHVGGILEVNIAMEFILDAERRLGEMLAGMEFNKGGRPKTDDTMSSVSDLPFLSEFGITPKQSSRWQAAARVPDEEYRKWIVKTTDSGKLLTSGGLVKLARREMHTPADNVEGVTESLQSLIDDGKKFGTVYADPPWRYGNSATRASADGEYSNTMSMEEICAEPVAELTTDPAHLHLWTTNGFLREAFDVIDAWGFTYKSCMVWVKPQMGIGNYWRVSHEFLLLGVKGGLVFDDHAQMSWVQADRTRHSRKPRVVRERIEKVSPGPYLEMYGREIVDDWTVYGNQVEKDLFHND
jgi:N6-adenosine-specific RNA methylase IME4